MKIIKLFVFILIIGAGVINSTQQNISQDQLELLKINLNEKEAIVWYLGHCGYAVKTKTKLLIFDYQENVKLPDRSEVVPPNNPSLFNGWINPEEIKDLDVVVFVSHSHSDHFDQKIFNWEKVVKKINYVFGWQEKEGKNYHSLPAPRKEAKFDGMEIYTVNSHHSGVPESSFLVKVDGLTIYHNGDYIGKMGENEPSNISNDMLYLKSKYEKVDLLFIGASTDSRLMEIVQALNPNVIFPMHYGYREEKYTEYYTDIKNKVKDIVFYIPQKNGDFCEYRNGTVVK